MVRCVCGHSFDTSKSTSAKNIRDKPKCFKCKKYVLTVKEEKGIDIFL